MSEVIEAGQEPATEQDEFEAAFAEFSGERDELSNEQEAVVDETPAEPEQPEVESQTEEPLVQGANESDADFETRLKAAESAAQEWEHKFKSEVGRQTALQRKVQELEAQLKAQPQSQQAQRQYSKRMESLMGDFPEIAEALQAELEEQLSLVRNELQQTLAPVRQLEEQRRFEAEEQQVKAKYPDYAQLVNSQEFMSWFQSQPDPVKSLAASPYAKDAIAVMDYFSATRRQVAANPEVQNIQAKRQQALEKHVSIKNSAPAPVNDGPDDFEAAFNHFASRLDRQRK